jgi:iron complex outermembrane receptor protein
MNPVTFHRLANWALFLALAFAMPAAAQDGDSSPSQPDWTRTLSLQELLDLELASPAKVPQTTREAPGSASLVTRQQIREYGWTSINDILFRQPGFFPSHDFERTTVGSRGIFESWANNHLLLLVDGIPSNDSETATAYTSEITPLFIAKDVEIIRGPGSALYGSSASNGVVSLNTVSAAKVLGESGDLQANNFAVARMGSQGTRAIDVLAAVRSPLVSTVLGFNHYQTQGNEYLSADGSGRTDASGALSRFLVQDHRENNYVFAKLEGREGLSGFQLEYHLQSWHSETGLGWLFWAPDVRVPQSELRHVLNLRYRSDPLKDFSFEATAQYQRHEVENNVRFLPDGAFGAYPAGVSESLVYATQEVFGRTQATWRLARKTSLLAGLESTTFLYSGDDDHHSNAALDDAANGFPASETTVQLGPRYEPVLGEPVWNLAPYAQLAAGDLFGLPLSLTAGVRYDSKFFHYRDLATGARERKSFEHLSPRVALVFAPTSTVSVKAQASNAFRTPTAAELFAAHTWVETPNLQGLKPEETTTFELGVDWTVSPNVTWRANVFDTHYQNTIFWYGPANTLLNLYSQRVAGAEVELLGEMPLGGGRVLSAFANYTYVKQLSQDTAVDAGLEASDTHLAWAPAHSAKAGASFRQGAFGISFQGIFQGAVARRGSDVDAASGLVRPGEVAPWTRFDLNAHYRVSSAVDLGLRVTNLLGTTGHLVKGGTYPFDYRVDARQIMASVEVDL